MDCRDIETLLNMQLDGVLPAKERAQLQAHLAHCPYCAVMAEEYARLDVMLKRDLPDVAPPNNFAASVMEKLPATNVVSIKTAASKRKVHKRLHWVGGAAVAAALVFGAMVGGFFNQNENSLPSSDENMVAEIQPFEDIFPELNSFVQNPQTLKNDNELTNDETGTTTPQPEPPEEETPPQEEEVPATYGDGISLPKVAYGSENQGSYTQTTLASTEGCNAILPRINGDIVTFYIEKDGAYLEYQTNLNPQSEPTFMGKTESLPYAMGVGKQSDSGYTATAADGTVAANQSDGFWITKSGSEAVQVSTNGGGHLVSWAPDGNKVLFTDGSGSLYAYYVAENICLTLQQNAVSSACWSSDGKAIVFAGTNPASGYSSIFKILVP